MSPHSEKNAKLGCSQKHLYSSHSQLVQNIGNKYALFPLKQATKFGLQGFEHARVTVIVGRYSKALHERLKVSTTSGDTTSTIVLNDDNLRPAVEGVIEELASVDLASVNLFEKLLAEYLSTNNSTQSLDVDGLISLRGESNPTAARQIVTRGIFRGDMQHWLELPNEEQPHSHYRVLYLSTGEQVRLVEALQIAIESRKLDEFIGEQRGRSQEQEASEQMLVNQIRQYDQQRQLQNREKHQLNTKIRWLSLWLGIAILFGALGTFYGLLID